MKRDFLTLSDLSSDEHLLLFRRAHELKANRRQRTLDFAPVDVDAVTLEKTGRALLSEYDRLRINAVCADFREPARSALAADLRLYLESVLR